MSIPKPLTIRVTYKDRVADITRTTGEEVVVSEGFTFIMLLQEIFTAYPEIEQKFPPGSLGLLINDRPPTTDDILREGDEVVIMSTNFSKSVS